MLSWIYFRKCTCIFFPFFTSKLHRLLKSFLLEDKNLFMLHSQYRDCWCSANAQSHHFHQNQCWIIVNWTLLGTKFSHISTVITILIQENEFQNVWKPSAILCLPQCVKGVHLFLCNDMKHLRQKSLETERNVIVSMYTYWYKDHTYPSTSWNPDADMKRICWQKTWWTSKVSRPVSTVVYWWWISAQIYKSREMGTKEES